MQVILIKSVRNLGKVGDTMSVANGYGRNFLIPQKFAIRATKENIASFETIKKDLESKNLENKNIAEKKAKAIEGKHISLVMNSAADGRLFGSVNTKLLAKEVSNFADIKLSNDHILLDEPIKFNGAYEVKVALHSDVITTVLILIAKSEAEAQDLLKKHREGEAAPDKEMPEGKEKESDSTISLS